MSGQTDRLKKVLPKLLRLVGIGIFVFFVVRADLSSVLDLALQARWTWILGTVGLQAFMLVTKAVRWWSLMRVMGFRFGFRETLACFFSGYFAGVVTPGRLGEFIRVAFVRQAAGSSLALAFFNVFVDRLFDLVFFVYCGLAGLTWFGLMDWRWLGVWVLAGTAAVVLLGREASSKWLARRVGRLVPRTEGQARGEQVQADFVQTMSALRRPASAGLIALTVVSNAVGFFGSVACVAWALGLDVSYLRVSAGVAMNGILSLVPITIGGLGTREAVFYYVFGQVGIGMEGVVAFCALNVVLVLLLPALACLPFFLYRGGVPLSGRPSELGDV